VVSAEGAISPAEDGAGAQQPALTDQEKAAAYAASRAALDQAQVGPPVRNEAFPTTNLAEYEAGLRRDQEQASAAEAERQAALEQIAGENIPQTKTDADIREQYEKTRVKLKEHGVI
jgi:hypothetical protein